MNLCDLNNIRTLLGRHGFHFSKAMGQNFLIDASIPQAIAEHCGADENCGVLEIGPGIGCLTEQLARRAGQVVSVELDRRLLPVLEETLSKYENVSIVSGDIMKLDIAALVDTHFSGLTPLVCANLPYNITTPVLSALIDSGRFQRLTVMIQKEVAERIAAGPGSKTYGILSILIQAWYKVEYLFTVHEHVFNPPPKVKSAVIRMTRNETTELGCNEKLFKLIVKTTFNQRRKTLRNSISSILDKENPLSTDPIFNKRPEQLSVQEFIELTNQVEAALKNKTDIVYSNDIARKGTNKKE